MAQFSASVDQFQLRPDGGTDQDATVTRPAATLAASTTTTRVRAQR